MTETPAPAPVVLDPVAEKALTDTHEAINNMLSQMRAELPVSFQSLNMLARGLGNNSESPLLGLATIGLLAFSVRYPEYLADYAKFKDESSDTAITVDFLPSSPVN